MAENSNNVIRETDAEAIRLAKTLIRTARYGALAALDPRTGAPLASRVAAATDLDGAPLILTSALSAHTGAILADPRTSLLLGEPGKGDPLAHPRISLSCRAKRLERGTDAQQRARRRYLARHPKAELYADFGDFSFFRLEPEAASLNGGFARAYLLTKEELVAASPAIEALAAMEHSALDHMNADHADAVDLYARAFTGAKTSGWKMTGIDPEGFDLARGDEVRRVFFATPLRETGELRPVLVRMAGEARVAAGA